MKIALGQILATRDVEENLAMLDAAAEQAAAGNASAVVFPEASMLSLDGSLLELTAAHHEEWEAGLAQIATRHQITVIAGGFAPADGLASDESAEPEDDDDRDATPRIVNQIRVVRPGGEHSSYTKIHLYDAFGFQESRTVAPGDALGLVDIDGVRVGLTCCYDVRFPKLFAELSRAGAQVILVPASWAGGEGKVNQWQLLTSARALDSNTFVVAVDQADPRTLSPEADWTRPLGVGHSRVVSPFGETVAELGAATRLEIVEIDLDQVERARTAIPVLDNAKLGY